MTDTGVTNEQLAGHLVGYQPGKDLVLIAFHKGKAYSATGQEVGWSDISKIAANLQLFVADQESEALLRELPGSLF